MIKKIVHVADIHIRKSLSRHKEYQEVFTELIKSLKTQNPDRIVIVGDLFHDYNKIEGELLTIASSFLNSLAEITTVIITRGNHDIVKSSLNRIDSTEAIVTAIANPKIKFLNTTGMFIDENVVWCVWKHGEKKNNPWAIDYIKDNNKIYIDLFHDPINGAITPEGHITNSNTYRTIDDFKGEYSFFGDYHKQQFLNLKKTKAYSGSLINQNFSEGDDQFHGYLLWDIINKTVDEIPVQNNYRFNTIIINRFTDFDNLNINIPNPAPNIFLRIKWQTLPAIKNVENESKLFKFLNEKYSPIFIKEVTDFIEENKIDIQELNTIENITKREVLHQIITDYLTKIGVENDVINDILKIDEEIENKIIKNDFTHIQWSIIKFYGKFFRNIKEINIDWRDKNGIFQITGENTAGKSSIIQLLSYILYGKTLETDGRKLFGDSRFVNNRVETNSCEGYLVLNCGGEYYGIKRVTTLKFNKKNELNGAPTVVNYYKLTTPDDTLTDEKNINNLNDVEKASTQKRIDEIIGTYENFTRIILTTADTLNKILSTDSSEFIDSILHDSGLDIFDARLDEFKKYRKQLIQRDRITCNLDVEESAISYLDTQNTSLDRKIVEQNNKISKLDKDIELIEKEKEKNLQRIHQIDPIIANLNENHIDIDILNHKKELEKQKIDESALTLIINQLKSAYDNNQLKLLSDKRELHKTEEYKLRTEINGVKHNVEQSISSLHRCNGDIELLKKEGGQKKQEIINLKNSKTCLTCGQIKTEDSLSHIQIKIKECEKQMFDIADKIKLKEEEKLKFIKNIDDLKKSIVVIENRISKESIDFESILVTIGHLNNDKQEVEKREKLVLELNTFPLKHENINLKITSLNEKLIRFKELKEKIDHNESIKKIISNNNNDLSVLKKEKQIDIDLSNKHQNDIQYNKKQIIAKHELIKKFKEQEKRDQVLDIYEKCINRDGIPTQILTNILLPKINSSLSNLLESVDFNVWLDPTDLRLKMSYSTHPNAIIDCISGSGKERTFSSISLKVALNEINCKSKPTMFMLDEIMGKLKGNSIDEFLDFLRIIKNKIRKTIVIEQNHEINPDYVINAIKDNNGISTITLLE